MTNYPSYPGTPYGTYDPGYDESADRDRVHGDGSLNVMKAVKWGFAATFKGWIVWILGSLAFLIIAFAGGVGLQMITGDPDNTYGNFAECVFGVVISTFAINAALRHIDNGRITWSTIGQRLRFWPTFGASALVSIITGLIYGAFLLVVTMGLVSTSANFDENTSLQQMTMFFFQLFGVLAVVMLGQFLIYPLLVFAPYSADDRDGSWWSNVVAGMRVGSQHYGKLLLFIVLYAVIGVVLCLVTLFLGVIVFLPATILIEAHIYRQISGGVLPTPATK